MKLKIKNAYDDDACELRLEKEGTNVVVRSMHNGESRFEFTIYDNGRWKKHRSGHLEDDGEE